MDYTPLFTGFGRGVFGKLLFDLLYGLFFLFKPGGNIPYTGLEARHEIMLESYTKKIQIESRVIGTLALNHILPTAIRYQTDLIRNVEGLKNIGMKSDTFKTQLDLIRELSEHVNVIKEKTDLMIAERKKANKIESHRTRAIAYCDKVKPYFDEIRYHVDKLELMIDDAYWPLPKYREMLSMR